MVELHYEDVDPDPIVHWRIVVKDEQAAIAQAAQDLAEGRNPIVIVVADSGTWDYARDYRPRDWNVLVSQGDLRRRARALRPALGG